MHHLPINCDLQALLWSELPLAALICIKALAWSRLGASVSRAQSNWRWRIQKADGRFIDAGAWPRWLWLITKLGIEKRGYFVTTLASDEFWKGLRATVKLLWNTSSLLSILRRRNRWQVIWSSIEELYAYDSQDMSTRLTDNKKSVFLVWLTDSRWVRSMLARTKNERK